MTAYFAENLKISCYISTSEMLMPKISRERLNSLCKSAFIAID